MKSTVFFAFFICFFANACFSQAIETCIYGCVEEENVDVQVLNTQYGTTSDLNGDYKFTLFLSKDKETYLLYTCIGYYDTIVIIKPQVIHQDSLKISFKMRPRNYELQEVSILADKDFYKTKNGYKIIDLTFSDNKIWILQSNNKHSVVNILDNESCIISSVQYDRLYDRLAMDCFDDIILIGNDSCRQIFLNEDKIITLSVFSTELFNSKLANCIAEFNEGYIFEDYDYNYDKYYVRRYHNQSTSFFYILKGDVNHTRKPLVQFLDTVGYKVSQQIFNEIISRYHQITPPNENVILLGVWNGNIKMLIPDNSRELFNLISQYVMIDTKKKNVFIDCQKDVLYIINCDSKEVVVVNKNYQIVDRFVFKILAQEQCFINQFQKDETTGKSYGIFVKDGIYYVALYNSFEATLGLTTKASNHIYPDVFKINGGYAYSVYFNKEKQYGYIDRVKIE